MSTRISTKILAAGLAACLGMAATNASAGVVTVTNGDSIAIPATGTSGPADPFPSTINVAGESGVITDLNVSLFGLTSTFPDDLDIALLGPNGVAIWLMSDAGGSADISNIDLAFDDEAAGLPVNGSTLTGGTYQVSNYLGFSDTGITDVITISAGDLSIFDGLSLNGVWSLYIHDSALGDVHSISQGWALEFTTSMSEVPIPGAIFLFAGGLAGLTRLARKKKSA